jgi:putative NADH-flavin reductase
MATIAIFGGTGYTGGNVAREAASRGHTVISYSRNLPADASGPVVFEQGSVHDGSLVQKVAAEVDVIVIAIHGHDPDGSALIDAFPALAEACIAGGARLAVMGGAGSSLVAEGGPRLVDTPEFHPEWKPEALAMADILQWLRESDEALDWFVVSPAALYGSYAPGETTGTYRTGGDVLVTKDDGSSEISGTDLALAFVDEIEQPQHSRQRFTVGH